MLWLIALLLSGMCEHTTRTILCFCIYSLLRIVIQNMFGGWAYVFSCMWGISPRCSSFTWAAFKKALLTKGSWALLLSDPISFCNCVLYFVLIWCELASVPPLCVVWELSLSLARSDLVLCAVGYSSSLFKTVFIRRNSVVLHFLYFHDTHVTCSRTSWHFIASLNNKIKCVKELVFFVFISTFHCSSWSKPPGLKCPGLL